MPTTLTIPSWARASNRRASCLAALLVASLARGTAAADERDRAVAESLFRHGRALFADGHVDEACEKFAESQRHDEQIGTLLNLAVCHEKQGKTATAWGEFTRAAVQAGKAGQVDRVAFAKLHITTLEPSLLRVTIAWEAPAPGATIRLDDVEYGTAVIGTELPLDPGRHTIEVSASGKHPWQMVFGVDPLHSAQSLQVPRLDDLEVARIDHPPVAAPMLVAPEPRPVRDRPAVWISAAVAVAGLAAGSYYGLHAFSLKHDAQPLCNGDACSMPGLDLYHQVDQATLRSTIAFGVGLAGGAAALYFALRKERPAPPAREVRVGLAPGGAAAAFVTAW
jgi:hypothetical protein